MGFSETRTILMFVCGQSVWVYVETGRHVRHHYILRFDMCCEVYFEACGGSGSTPANYFLNFSTRDCRLAPSAKHKGCPVPCIYVRNVSSS